MYTPQYPVGQHQIFNVIPRSKLLEMSEAGGREGGGNGSGGGNDKIARHVELLERKIAKLARRERRAAANRELGEKILLEKLRMAEEGEGGGREEDGIRYDVATLWQTSSVTVIWYGHLKLQKPHAHISAQ